MSVGSTVEAVTGRTPDESGARAGTLLSVNVGLPRDVSWQGRTVHTGVWKYPVEGSRTVRRLNLDGDLIEALSRKFDRTAGDLVPAYFPTPERELGRDDFSYGQFGENFTVEGWPTTLSASVTSSESDCGLRGDPAAGHLLPSRRPDGRSARTSAAGGTSPTVSTCEFSLKAPCARR
jgi:hypothetical protein